MLGTAMGQTIEKKERARIGQCKQGPSGTETVHYQRLSSFQWRRRNEINSEPSLASQTPRIELFEKI
jgi:hypothetical protein